MTEDMELLCRLGSHVPFTPASVVALAATSIWNERPLIILIGKRSFSDTTSRELRCRHPPEVAHSQREIINEGSSTGPAFFMSPRQAAPRDSLDCRVGKRAIVVGNDDEDWVIELAQEPDAIAFNERGYIYDILMGFQCDDFLGLFLETTNWRSASFSSYSLDRGSAFVLARVQRQSHGATSVFPGFSHRTVRGHGIHRCGANPKVRP